MTIQVKSWTLDEHIDSLPDPEPRYDYWPWPGVLLLNERRPFVPLSSKKARQTERTSS